MLALFLFFLSHVVVDLFCHFDCLLLLRGLGNRHRLDLREREWQPKIEDIVRELGEVLVLLRV